MLTRFLSTLGLVRARRYIALERALRKAEARNAKVAQSLEDARREIHEWRAKTSDAAKRAAALEHRLAREGERLAKVRADLAAQLDAERLRVADLQDALRQRMAGADRDLSVARDHLMAIEVKLDILEGAANVLDGRTRDVLARERQRESSAPV